MEFWLHSVAMSEKKNAAEKIANIAPFGVRMPAELKERVQLSAVDNNRSMNAEVVHLLAFSLDYFDRQKKLWQDDSPAVTFVRTKSAEHEENTLESPDGRAKLFLAVASIMLENMKIEYAANEGRDVGEDYLRSQRTETASLLHDVFSVLGSIGIITEYSKT